MNAHSPTEVATEIFKNLYYFYIPFILIKIINFFKIEIK